MWYSYYSIQGQIPYTTFNCPKFVVYIENKLLPKTDYVIRKPLY